MNILEINTMFIKKYFDYVISGDEVKVSKPDPEIYLKAANELCSDFYIAVEDSTIGICAAKNANLYTVALKQKYPINQKKADLIIENLDDILQIPQIEHS